MLEEITLTRVQFDAAFEEVLDHIREAAEKHNDPLMLLRMGTLAALIGADLQTTLFKEVTLEVKDEPTKEEPNKEEPTNGDKDV